MRSSALGKNSHRSILSTNQNITSIHKLGTFQTISNDVKFMPSEDSILFSQVDQCNPFVNQTGILKEGEKEALHIKVILKQEKSGEQDHIFTIMGIFITEVGKMINPMAKGSFTFLTKMIHISQ